MKKWQVVVLSLGVGLGGGVAMSLAALRAAAPWMPTGPVTEGVRFEGATVPSGVAVSAWLEGRATAAKERKIALHHPDGHFEVSLGELGLSVDVAATEARAREVAHVGSFARRAREARAARRGEIAVEVTYRLDRAVAVERLAKFADGFDREPVAASIDLDKHARIDDVPGRKLEAGATADRIADRLAALATGVEFGVELATTTTRAPVTSSDLENIDVTKVLASFDTQYSVFKVGRSKNVVLAAKKLDGLVLAPGATMSFNERVGPRTREAGFELAPEIVGDELSVGYGGGTCQVSSTLFGAAMHGGLVTISRKNHSRLSDYTKLGLDATVKYPSVDLQLKNGYDFGVVVHAFVPKPGTLRVELLGGDPVAEAKYVYGVSKVEPYLRRITVKGFMKPGTSVQRQKGTRAMDVYSTVILKFKDGRTERRGFFSAYRATPEVFWVGPDFDRATLPPLPEHAKGVEGEEAPPAADDVYSG